MRARAGLYVRLGETGYDALCDVAAKQWRDPGEQAAKFVFEGLKRAGALPRPPRELARTKPVGGAVQASK
jgi:hypothetical protein